VSIDEEGAATTYTFGALAERSSRLAGGLRRAGIRRGARVAIVAPQSLEVGLSHLALWKLGAVSLPLASLFGPDAISYRITDSGAALAIVSPDNLDKVTASCPGLPIVEAGTQFDALCAGDPIEVPADTAADDPADLIYTSGTTGQPKGALHAHRSLIGHLPGFELYYDFAAHAPMGRSDLSVLNREDSTDDPPDDLIWTPADWAWIGGLMDVLIPAWYFGMPVLTATHDFDPAWAADLIESRGVTLAFLPPTALKMMRAAGVSRPHTSLRAIFTGGEALGEAMLAWVGENLGCAVNEGYGQTEANLVVGNCSSLFPVRAGSMGRAVPGHHVRVLDEAGVPVVGRVGEIAVRSPDPVIMLEYWGLPGATTDKYQGEWLLTGDLGVEDADGHLWFRSRKDDLIMSMGYRIGPGEIEASLMGHAAVAMCAVVGVPDDIRGEVPAAFVVLRQGFEASHELVEALQHHVRTRLAGHEVPRRVTFVDDLPRTTTGKIMRRALRTDPASGVR
jgi:acetyl-CoA synthetase